MKNKEKIESLKNEIISRIKISIKTESEKYKNYQDPSNRKYIFEDIGVKVVESVLRENFNSVLIYESPSSRYPEVEFEIDGNLYAIDIKTAYNSAAPAFDLAYFSRYEKEMFNKYEEDWVISIKHDKNKKIADSVDEVFFNRLYELANVKKNGLISHGGHGVKVRPLSWGNIENGKFKINSKEEFLDKINLTLMELKKVEKYKKVINKQLANFNKSEKKVKEESKNKRSLRISKSVDEYIAAHIIAEKFKGLNIKKIAKLLLVEK